jgi:basic membrane lipoprotein Med (substrate-binding protein (PBP1-ABC) superfamily)
MQTTTARSRRRAALPLALVLALALASCGSDGDDDSASGGDTGGDELSLVVLIGGPRDDGGFYQQMVEGMEQAAEDDGAISVDVRERIADGGDSALDAAVREAASSGDYDLIIAHGFDIVPSVGNWAPEYPDQAFATSLPVQGSPPNAEVYLTDFEDSGYSAGFLAATAAAQSDADAIGFISGPGQDFEQQTEAGFSAAVDEYAPGTRVEAVYTGDFENGQLGQETASQMIGDGVDVIWNLLAGGQSGVYRACEEAGDAVSCFGNSSFSAGAAPEVVLASNYSDYATLLPVWAERLRAGEWADGDQPFTDVLTLGSGGVTVTDATEAGTARLGELQPAIDDFRSAATSGEIEVPDAAASG